MANDPRTPSFLQRYAPAAQSLETIPASIGQQIFSIVPGIAGGLAGFLLAYRLANATRVKTSTVIVVALANAVLTLATLFLIKPVAPDE